MISFSLNKVFPNKKSNRSFRIVLLKSKLTFKLIISLLVFNFLVSIAILKQQSQLTSVFTNFYDQQYDDDKNFNLLPVLNAYRKLFKEIPQKLNSDNFNALKKYITSQETIANANVDNDAQLLLDTRHLESDYLFSRSSFYDLLDYEKLKTKKFYEPKFIVNNENSCKVPLADEPNTIIILCLIHSHKDNFLRRQTMRDTWMRSLNNVTLFDLVNREKLTNFKDDGQILNKKIKLVHLFVVGKDVDDQNMIEFDRIKLESDFYNDIIMIDTAESYKNLIYKHLAIINW